MDDIQMANYVDMYLPSGNISCTGMWLMAKT